MVATHASYLQPARIGAAPKPLGSQPAASRLQQHIVKPCQSVRGVCSSRRQQCRGREPQPQVPLRLQEQQQQQQQQAAAADRRGVLVLLAAAGAAMMPASQATAVAAPAAAPAAPPASLPMPPLTEVFISEEGFRFNYPADWVVAFDRTGSTGNGAVIVVGDFRALITVSVFRTTTVAEAVVRTGLDDVTGYEICVEPQQRQAMRFQLLRSAMAAPAAPAAVATPEGETAAAGGTAAYEFEFSIDSCAGEVEEGLGGTLRCLGPFGNIIPSQRRHHIGRCLLINGTAYSLNANSPEDRWVQVGPILKAVVSTFQA